MKILIVAATQFEILPLLGHFNEHFEKKDDTTYHNGDTEVKILVTGVGLMHTAFALGYSFASYWPDIAINAGLAGAFDRNIKIGEVVNVVAELQADLGVEENNGEFTDMFELGLLKMNDRPYINGRLYNTEISGFDFLTSVRGISVNKVHGTANSIEKIIEKYHPDVESMEGAAFFFACLQASIPFLEIRAISNYVEPRNRENWSVELAIDNLNKTLIDILEILCSSEDQ